MELKTYIPPANAILHYTTAYMDSRPPAAPVHIVQYDFTLPIIAAALYAGGTPYTAPQGGSVNIRMGKPDGTVVYNPALGLDESRSTAYIAVTPQMTIFAGDFAPVLEVSAGGGIAATGGLSLIIDPNPAPNEKIQSASEYKTVQQLAALAAESAAAAAQSAQNAAASETEAGAAQAAAQTAQGAAQDARAEAQTSASNAASSAAQAAADAAAATQRAAAAAASAEAAQEAAEKAQQIAQGALGYYVDVDALQAAHPTGEAGQWAIVGNPDSIWVWDVEGEQWVNSGQSIELSDYYTKGQTNALLDSALGRPVAIPTPAAGWQGPEDGPWTNTVTVEGVTALTELSNILPAQGSAEAAQQAALQWQALETGAGTVVLTAGGRKPAVDFTLTAIARQTKGADGDAAE